MTWTSSLGRASIFSEVSLPKDALRHPETGVSLFLIVVQVTMIVPHKTSTSERRHWLLPTSILSSLYFPLPYVFPFRPPTPPFSLFQDPPSAMWLLLPALTCLQDGVWYHLNLFLLRSSSCLDSSQNSQAGSWPPPNSSNARQQPQQTLLLAATGITPPFCMAKGSQEQPLGT